MTSNKGFGFLGLCLLFFMLSCSKTATVNPTPNPPPIVPNSLTYGDSVFFLNGQSTDYIIHPLHANSGTYSAFPEGLEIDQQSGAVNVSKSDAGLKYRVSFVPTGSNDSLAAIVIISGINFLDGFYKLNTADSIARPIYNASQGSNIPGLNNGTVFDEGSKCNSKGCTVNVGNGTINLAQTVRNGVFGATPSNNDRHEFDLDYKINDQSGKAFNTIRVKLYYFETMSDVTQEVYDIISSREGTIIDRSPIFTSAYPVIQVNGNASSAGVSKAAKPRPPCIFIVSR